MISFLYFKMILITHNFFASSNFSSHTLFKFEKLYNSQFSIFHIYLNIEEGINIFGNILYEKYTHMYIWFTMLRYFVISYTERESERNKIIWLYILFVYIYIYIYIHIYIYLCVVCVCVCVYKCTYMYA